MKISSKILYGIFYVLIVIDAFLILSGKKAIGFIPSFIVTMIALTVFIFARQMAGKEVDRLPVKNRFDPAVAELDALVAELEDMGYKTCGGGLTAVLEGEGPSAHIEIGNQLISKTYWYKDFVVEMKNKFFVLRSDKFAMIFLNDMKVTSFVYYKY